MASDNVDEFSNTIWPEVDYRPTPYPARSASADFQIPDIEPLPQAFEQAYFSLQRKVIDDEFRGLTSSLRKRRRALEDDEPPTVPHKVVVTEQLRVRDNPVARWVRKAVCARLRRKLVYVCTELVRASDENEAEWKQFLRRAAVKRRRWELQQQQQQQQQQEGLAAPVPVPVISVSGLEGEHSSSPPEEEEVVGQPNSFSVPDDEYLSYEKEEGRSEGDLAFAEDHVYPEYPNLDSYRELYPGDSRQGAFRCEHCLETFRVTRELRLHVVDEHLLMTGGAGPAGTLEDSEEEEEEEA
ncbi:hypothetical protein K458DRAFT_434093 [Lentithecium fluviatile CBS 122367]|uniref:C2H2-type domain-containing protein n=1 Tax=Lentithecium fluviatile CBS 122367 TaxID=1168545 RepID=A0A6G1IRP2_9PLEO|nr:hypothetical protein K458DRAFT_434093 [Lentithecium fluviatile CBS 122367]